MDIVALLIGIILSFNLFISTFFFSISNIFGFIIGFLWVQIQRIGVEKKIRQDAVRGSRNAITGEIYEKILPSMPNFPYAPKDMVFVGKWTDYIIFDGLSEGDLREIIFLEIKSGKSRLNANEKMIKKILDEKIVRFAEMRVGAPKNDE